MDHASECVTSHDVRTPLFLYMAFQDVHGPTEAPQRFFDLYSAGIHPARLHGLAQVHSHIPLHVHWRVPSMYLDMFLHRHRYMGVHKPYMHLDMFPHRYPLHVLSRFYWRAPYMYPYMFPLRYLCMCLHMRVWPLV